MFTNKKNNNNNSVELSFIKNKKFDKTTNLFVNNIQL